MKVRLPDRKHSSLELEIRNFILNSLIKPTIISLVELFQCSCRVIENIRHYNMNEKDNGESNVLLIIENFSLEVIEIFHSYNNFFQGYLECIIKYKFHFKTNLSDIFDTPQLFSR